MCTHVEAPVIVASFSHDPRKSSGSGKRKWTNSTKKAGFGGVREPIGDIHRYHKTGGSAERSLSSGTNRDSHPISSNCCFCKLGVLFVDVLVVRQTTWDLY